MNSTGLLENALGRFRQPALVVGGLGLAACLLAGLTSDRASALHSYLFAFVSWTGVGLGGMAILILHHMVGGTWVFALLRPLEAVSRNNRWMVLIDIPL